LVKTGGSTRGNSQGYGQTNGVLLMVEHLIFYIPPEMFGKSNRLFPAFMGTEDGKLFTAKPTGYARFINFHFEYGTDGLQDCITTAMPPLVIDLLEVVKIEVNEM